jgi:hypothetical protein
MTRRVILKPAAEAEMEQAHAWYEQRKAGLGHEFLDASMAASLRYSAIPKRIRWHISTFAWRW